MKGTILEYHRSMGFGHLRGIEAVDEFCFYTADIKVGSEQLKKGDHVEFDIYKGSGMRAVNVRNVVSDN